MGAVIDKSHARASTGYHILRNLLASVLLTTAGLIGWQLLTDAVVGSGPLDSACSLLALAAFGLFSGLWLLTGGKWSVAAVCLSSTLCLLLGCDSTAHVNQKEPPDVSPQRPSQNDDEWVHDFGIVEAGTTQSHVFRLQNTSGVSLSFEKFQASCTCTGLTNDDSSREKTAVSLPRIGLLALTSILSGGIAFADEPAGLTWDDLFSGMRFERERLISGAYSGSGTEMPLRIDQAVPFTLYSAFSFAEGKMRFEHRSRGWVRRAGQLVERDTHRLICLLPDRTYHFSDLSSSLMLNIAAPGTLELRRRQGTRGFLDPRCLGLLRINNMYKGIRFEDVAGKWSAALAGSRIEVREEGDGVYRAWAISARGRMSFWIDAKRGFTLVRFQLENGMGDETAGQFTPLSQVVAEHEALREKMKEKNIGMDLVVDVPEEIEIGWAELNGVWVPKSYKHVLTVQRKNDSQDPGAPPLKLARREMTLTLDWTSVNSALNDDLFDYHSFDLPVGTTVFDERGPASVFVERIGSQPVARASRKLDVQPRSYWPLVIMIHLTAVVGIVVGYLVYRRRRKSASQKTPT